MEQTMRESEEPTASCEHGPECQCDTSQETESPAGSNEEMALAFLLALMPLVVLTFFGQVGLI